MGQRELNKLRQTPLRDSQYNKVDRNQRRFAFQEPFHQALAKGAANMREAEWLRCRQLSDADRLDSILEEMVAAGLRENRAGQRMSRPAGVKFDNDLVAFRRAHLDGHVWAACHAIAGLSETSGNMVPTLSCSGVAFGFAPILRKLRKGSCGVPLRPEQLCELPRVGLEPRANLIGEQGLSSISRTKTYGNGEGPQRCAGALGCACARATASD